MFKFYPTFARLDTLSGYENVSSFPGTRLFLPSGILVASLDGIKFRSKKSTQSRVLFLYEDFIIGCP